MSDYTKYNLREVENAAPKFQMPEDMEARFARGAIEGETLGLSLFTLAPNFRIPFGHKHPNQEEVYVLVKGSARIKIEDEIVELQRVGRGPVRQGHDASRGGRARRSRVHRLRRRDRPAGCRDESRLVVGLDPRLTPERSGSGQGRCRIALEPPPPRTLVGDHQQEAHDVRHDRPDHDRRRAAPAARPPDRRPLARGRLPPDSAATSTSTRSSTGSRSPRSRSWVAPGCSSISPRGS